MTVFLKRIIGASVLALLAGIPVFSNTNETTLNGRNVIWSPSQDLLLYAATGKSSGSLIWRIFDPGSGN